MSTPASLMTGASSGRTISTISNQSRKNPATNTTASTTSTRPTGSRPSPLKNSAISSSPPISRST